MILITGAAGYLGSVVVHRAVAAGHAVRALVRDPQRAAALLPAGVEVAVADLLDAAAVRTAAAGCSAVLHLGGTVGGEPALIHRTNVEGTRAVLAAARAAGVRRFVHTSTGAAVLDADGLMADVPVGPPVLTDPYSASKTAAEEIVRSAAGIETVIVRPAAIYGPSPRGPQSYNGLFLAAARGEVPAVVDAAVGWVLAEDAAEGHLLALDRGEPGRAYVLCGEVATFGRVLALVTSTWGMPPVPVAPRGTDLGPDAGTFARRSQVYGMQPPLRVDDRGLRELGFRPRGVEEGIALTVDWLRTWREGERSL